MRQVFLWMLCLLAGSPAWGDDIVGVLRRSQDARLAAFEPVDAASPRAAVVRHSFETLRRTLPETMPPVELRIVRGPVLAETVHGSIVVANESLADVSEPARVFVLAHELGHVARGHWVQLVRVYQKWVPGEVTQGHTDVVAPALGQDASALVRMHEFEADAFAAHTLHALGWSQPETLAAFMQLGAHGGTATHPGTHRRFASLRALAPGP